MTARRISSRRVVLTATFLALAAGGAAACDASADEEWDSADSSTFVQQDGAYVPEEEIEEEVEEVVDDGAEVFYCADEDGEIVEEEYCADPDPDPAVPYFLWHSTGYDRHMTPGMILDGGDRFAPNDRASRRAFKLPATGRVPNSTIKTNVVGSGSGSRGGSGSTAGSGSTGGSGFSSGGSGLSSGG